MFKIFNRDISTKKVLFGIFTILCLFFLYKNIDVAILLFISLVFACSMNPIVDRLEKKMPRIVASIIVLLGALLILGLVFTVVIILGAYQLNDLISNYPQYVKNLDNLIKESSLFHAMGITKFDVGGITASMASSAEGIIDYLMGLLSGMGSGLLYCVTGIIFTFFFMQDKKIIKNTILDYFPVETKKRAEEIIDNISTKIGGYVFAQTLAILSVFVFNAVGLLIFHVPYAISIAIITGILDIVPVIGPALAIIICLIGVYEFGIKAVIITLIVTCLTQVLENNFVRPIAFSKLMNLHPIIIFLSLILGGKYFGFIGILFGPAIAATICVLLNELYVKNIK